jgi:hypothetical protein
VASPSVDPAPRTSDTGTYPRSGASSTRGSGSAASTSIQPNGLLSAQGDRNMGGPERCRP